MLWWLKHYAIFDMAALLFVIWAYGLFQWLKIGESRADLPRTERAASYFSSVKRSFIRGKVQLARQILHPSHGCPGFFLNLAFGRRS